MRDANFFNTRADRRHRLEIVRLLATLHPLQLIAGIVSRILGKVTQGLERVAEETDGRMV